MPGDATASIAEQARAFLTWAEQEIHDGVILPGALQELKHRIARLLYALAHQAVDAPYPEGGAAARLWAFFPSVDPRQQPVGHRLFIESFRDGGPTDRTLRDLWHADYLGVGPPSGVNSASWKAAVGNGFAGPAAVAELLQAVRGIASHRESGADSRSDTLSDVAITLLRRVSERWAEYDADALTATESKALCVLVAAGLVERRGRFRLRMHNNPLAVEATFMATGEYGFVEAMEHLVAGVLEDWKGAFQAWRTGQASGAPAFFCERLKPDEWRLTEEGVAARKDLGASKPHVVLDFVLRRGFFHGRQPVRGAGALVRVQKVQASPMPSADVAIRNWREGAEAFAAAFRADIKTLENGRTAVPPDTGAAKRGWNEQVGEYLDRNQKDLDQMADAYRSGNTEFGEALYKKLFSPSAVARALNARHAGSIQRTEAYRERVMKYRNRQRDDDSLADGIRRRAPS